MPNETCRPLPRGEVIKAVERRRPVRVPMAHARWWGEGLQEQYGDRLLELERYPEDVESILINPLLLGKMGLSWYDPERFTGAHDAGGVLPDWKYLDEFIEKIPRGIDPALFDGWRAQAEKAHAEDRYLLFGWWRLFFERPWGLRGMENLMIDYYEHPDEVHRLHQALCDWYVELLDWGARELAFDGFWTSDDLGNQRQLMMKPDHFRGLIKPYYERVARACRRARVHFWLHSCGNNTEILSDLIEVGLDVFHPVQKHTMDEAAVAAQWGDRLTFLAGFDVQQTLQTGTPDQVRAEVRFLIDTFDRPDGGMCLAAGNGIVAGTPFENIEAFLDEGVVYGTRHRTRMNRS